MDVVWTCSLCDLFKRKPNPDKTHNHHSRDYHKRMLKYKEKYKEFEKYSHPTKK